MRRWVVVVLGFALAACGGAPAPTLPDTGPAAAPTPTEAVPAPSAPVPFVEHEVQPGETLWDICRAYGVSRRAVLEFNHMRAGDVRQLSVGAHLRIPGATEVRAVETAPQRIAAREQERASLPPVTDGAYHFLEQGQTLHEVAALYEVEVDAILERNGIDPDDAGLLRPGRALVIPGLRASRVRQSAEAATPQREEHLVHTLARGETIWDIAGSFGVPVSELMSANSLDADEAQALHEGARLVIPGIERDRRGGRAPHRATAREVRAASVAHALGLGSREVAGQLLHGHVRAEWIRAAGSRAVMPGTLRWPVQRGWFVRGFGSGEGGYHQAVDIMGEMGWNVRASAPGIVAYAGDEVPGYGRIVMLVHPGGWVTMYAHNSVNLVVAGERVPAGAVLAEVGSTGISRGPHVHFELMYNGQNCDPAVLFRPGIRHRNGRIQPLGYTTWTDRDARPGRVTCQNRRRHPHSRWVVHEDPVRDAERGE